MARTLFVAGFNRRTEACDLAFEFERYGRLVRCDIPAPKTYSARPYAFVEFEDRRDAYDAFHEMQGRRLDGSTISVQWARNRPRTLWRYDRRPGSRSRSPRRPRSVSPPRERYSSRSYSPSRRGADRMRTPPAAYRNNTRSPAPHERKSP